MLDGVARDARLAVERTRPVERAALRRLPQTTRRDRQRRTTRVGRSGDGSGNETDGARCHKRKPFEMAARRRRDVTDQYPLMTVVVDG